MASRLIAVVAMTLVASTAWAGVTKPVQAPALGESGLILLGLGLVGAGLALLRRK